MLLQLFSTYERLDWVIEDGEVLDHGARFRANGLEVGHQKLFSELPSECELFSKLRDVEGPTSESAVAGPQVDEQVSTDRRDVNV